MGKELKKKALVTGGTGYIGDKLVKKLLSKGFKVTVMTRNSKKIKNTSVDVLEFDTHSPFLVKEFPQNLDVVIHLATEINDESTINDISKIVEANICFPAKLLHAMHLNDCKKFINVGTYWQSSRDDVEVGNTVYSSSKSALIPLINYYCYQHGMSAISIRLPDIYGEDDKRNKLLTCLSNAPVGSDFPLTLGEQIISPLHVDDVVEAFLVVVKSLEYLGKEHKEYSIFGEEMTLHQFVEEFCEVNKLDVNLLWGIIDYPIKQIFKPINLEKLPNWDQRIKILEGFEKYKS